MGKSMCKNVPPLCGSGALYIHEAFASPAETSASGLDELLASRMLEECILLLLESLIPEYSLAH